MLTKHVVLRTTSISEISAEHDDAGAKEPMFAREDFIDAHLPSTFRSRDLRL